MDAELKVGFECPSCGDWVELTDLGLAKPILDKLKEMTAFQRWECGECEERYDTEEGAMECCKE